MKLSQDHLDEGAIAPVFCPYTLDLADSMASICGKNTLNVLWELKEIASS